MTRWAMIINLDKCVGCGACAVACGMYNQVDTNSWRRVFDCGQGPSPERIHLYVPMSCMHCTNPPCRKVCPTTATYVRPDGIVEIDLKKCIGCGYCMVACPYLARVLLHNNETAFEASLISGSEDDGERRDPYLGVCTKCNFCRERVEDGLAKQLTPGIDREATPACVINCTSDALAFGDLEDPESPVRRLLADHRVSTLQPDLNTRPCLFYIHTPGEEED
jgi:phenylacetyl-CoA:acceptor oxidoreductase subunit 1